MKKKESIFQLLSQKPWDPNQAKIDDLHQGETLNITKGKLGLRFVMVVSTIFFCLFIVTYSDRMVFGDWKVMPEPPLLWLNTFVLILCSASFISANLLAKKNNFIKVKNRLITAGILTLVFLFGQLIVWEQLIKSGYYISSNPANAYFYVFTTLHGFHLLGGLIYWYLTIKKVWIINQIAVNNAKQSIELCGIYWHFLLAVWIVLFGLMIFS